MFKIDSYTLIKGNRSYGKRGGVEMHVKSSIKFKRTQDLENPLLEIIVSEIFIKNVKSILIASYYRTPEGWKYLPSIYNDSFNEHLENFSHNKEVLLKAHSQV